MSDNVDDNEERLRTELRNLRRVRARGSFEAELQQRLRRRTAWSARWIARPVPAYALSAITIVVLGIVGYYALLQPPPTVEDQAKDIRPGEYEISSPASQTTLNGQSVSPQQVPSRQSISPGEPAHKGPASVGTEATIEAKVENRQTESASGATPQPQIEFRYSPESSSQSQKGLLPLEDQRPASVLKVSGDSLAHDSAKARADSIKKLPRNHSK